MSAIKVRTAVIPAAGLGTRFVPATKAVPKEMLPVLGKPAIQWVVEEARQAGVEHFVFIVGRCKTSIEDHFDCAVELEAALETRGAAAELAAVRSASLPPGAAVFVRQQATLGLGHAIWCARYLVGNDPFAVLLPDVLTRGARGGCLAEMVDTYPQTGGTVVGIEKYRPEDSGRFGVVKPGNWLSATSFEISAMIEKPTPDRAPSNLRINGRYILQPEIFRLLETQAAGYGGEIQLTDALARVAAQGGAFGHLFGGRSFDCGSPAGYLACNVAFAGDEPELAAMVRREVARYREVRSSAGHPSGR